MKNKQEEYKKLNYKDMTFKNNWKIIVVSLCILLTTSHLKNGFAQKSIDENIISYIVNPKKQDLKLYWKNDQGEILKSFKKFKNLCRK